MQLVENNKHQAWINEALLLWGDCISHSEAAYECPIDVAGLDCDDMDRGGVSRRELMNSASPLALAIEPVSFGTRHRS